MIPQTSSYIDTDIVLVGAGHANVQVMRAFGMNPMAGVRVTVIVDRLLAPYSGMLPGCIAGDYTTADIHIDVGRLARQTGCRLIQARAIGVDRTAKQVLLEGRPPIAYDFLALNVGITPDLSGIQGAAEHAVPVKPIATLLHRLTQAEASIAQLSRPARLTVVGGGAAGIELAIALNDRNRKSAHPAAEITLIAGGGLAPALNEATRRRARKALEQAKITIIEGDRTEAITSGAILLTSGRRIESDATFVSTNAKLPDWLTAAELPKAPNGGIAVKQTLQLVGDDAVFAAGDCATMAEEPRPRAGVFAVRQGPVLARNLMAAARDEPLETYQPQHDFLTILRTAKATAVAGRGRFFSVSGKWVWNWKDRIDRAFMEKFLVPDADPLNEENAMRCGGCAAKVGPEPLAAALSRLPPPLSRADIDVGMDARDDAAIIRWGSAATLVQTVDQFRAFISDPYLFGRIAALHALNDIHAMGAIPHHALLLATLPHGTSSKVAEALFQLLAGARATLDAEGCALVGGHSSEGETMALGLSVSGRLDQPAIGKRGGRPGDCLILTKPLGSGIVFAADMRASVNAPLVEAMLAQMTRSNASAARILRKTGARAMTDVSGFGLIGHLAEMLGDDLGATLNPAPPPYLEGVLALARKGFASSLLPENMRLSARLRDAKAQDAAMLAILFDPQTSGGLLAAVPSEKATATIMELVESGYAASKIGAITGDRSITIGQPVSDRP